MSEEKLYAVKNDEGEWLNQYCFGARNMGKTRQR